MVTVDFAALVLRGASAQEAYVVFLKDGIYGSIVQDSVVRDKGT